MDKGRLFPILTAKIDRDAFYQDWRQYAITNSYDDWHTGYHIVKRLPSLDQDKVTAILGYSPTTTRVLIAYAEYRLRQAKVTEEVLEKRPIPIGELVDHRSSRWWKDTDQTVSLVDIAKERGIDLDDPSSMKGGNNGS